MGGGGGGTAKFFSPVGEVLFVTDFRRVGVNEIMCSGGWWVCFQYYLYKIVPFIIKLYNKESSVKLVREWIKLSLVLSEFLYRLPICASVLPQRDITTNGLSFLVPGHQMRSNGFKYKIIAIGKSIVWKLSLPANFNTCVDDHVCNKIRTPHFLISYVLYRTSTNA